MTMVGWGSSVFLLFSVISSQVILAEWVGEGSAGRTVSASHSLPRVGWRDAYGAHLGELAQQAEGNGS